ncbi:hypothetical protein Hypma_013229 [Hypsizygus marmoreus]|uniref:Uncharacterized protein n=1 Tax=Hypsizygus marmoreus TaxID=39966 RepID=A0A369JC74_HYPMA|nr:hypothetical protein Hypma_013229 [Hypsizygus marmoreus]
MPQYLRSTGRLILHKIFPNLKKRHHVVGIIGTLNKGPKDFLLVAEFVHLHGLTPADSALSHWFLGIDENGDEFDVGDPQELGVLLRSEGSAECTDADGSKSFPSHGRHDDLPLHSKFVHQLYRTATDATRSNVISIVLMGRCIPSGDAIDVGGRGDQDTDMITPSMLERVLRHTKAARIFIISSLSLSNNWINPLWTLISVPSLHHQRQNQNTRAGVHAPSRPDESVVLDGIQRYRLSFTNAYTSSPRPIPRLIVLHEPPFGHPFPIRHPDTRSIYGRLDPVKEAWKAQLDEDHLKELALEFLRARPYCTDKTMYLWQGAMHLRYNTRLSNPTTRLNYHACLYAAFLFRLHQGERVRRLASALGWDWSEAERRGDVKPMIQCHVSYWTIREAEEGGCRVGELVGRGVESYEATGAWLVCLWMREGRPGVGEEVWREAMRDADAEGVCGGGEGD